MIHEFDILVLDGGNLVISDDLNILRNTLQISLSVIVLNEEDIDHIFAPKMTKICFETQEGITDISDIFLGIGTVFHIFQHRMAWAFQKCPQFLSWAIRKMTICRKLSGACFVGHPVYKKSHL